VTRSDVAAWPMVPVACSAASASSFSIIQAAYSVLDLVLGD
jgi:hypothetical protein